jgi:thioesterase domain-containing protein/acyl carrier protein
LTASKFLPDPFSHDRKAKLYRTGDWVRQRNERSLECLEFLGRLDTQVKIRGYRIELGEIEATLLRNAMVAQAVAIVVRSDIAPTIHAFVVLQPATLPLSDELRMRLRSACNKHLPSYMHPATITALLHFPQTPNGKVDRQALSRLDRHSGTAAPESLSGVQSPEDMEQRLRAIWSSLLDLGEIPVDANFFLLGGNSLLAMRLLERIEHEFGVPLTPAVLFGAPTLGEQVVVLQRWSSQQFDFRQVVRLNTDGRRPPLIAIHNTGVYCYHLAQSLGADQPLTALQLFDPSRLDLPATLEGIAAEYVRLIKQLYPVGPYRLIGWCVGGVLAFEVARQLSVRRESVSFLGLIDAWAPGNRRRISKLRAWFADLSYRTQLIWADWLHVRARQQTVREFLRNRVLVRKLLRLREDDRSASLARKFAERHQSSEHYDRWLAGYLDVAAERYTLRPYAGKVQLLVSSREPSGWFLDPLKGWQQFVSGGIETTELEGDHFTVFRGVGLQQLATALSAALAGLQSQK